MNCYKCGGELSTDEIGLHRKLVNRGSTRFMCLNCLAEHFSVSRERLIEKTEEFKAAGCMLFAANKSEENT